MIATELVKAPANVVQQRIVTTDQVVGDKWVVTSGLQAGDRLIVDGLLNLHPGAKVKARPATAGKLRRVSRFFIDLARSSLG